MCLFLNELQEHGICKRLELYRRNSDRWITNSDLLLLKSINKLQLNFHICGGDGPIKMFDPSFDESVELKSLQSLEEFNIKTTSSIKDIEVAATNLQNLERLDAEYVHFGHIVPFVGESAKLKKKT